MKKGIIAAVAAAVLISGGALMVSANDRDDRAARENVIAGKDIGLENEAAQKDIITKEEAKKIAGQETGGKVEEAELEMDKNNRVYEVETKKGEYEYEVHVAADSGKVIRTEKDRDDDRFDDDRHDDDDDDHDDDDDDHDDDDDDHDDDDDDDDRDDDD